MRVLFHCNPAPGQPQELAPEAFTSGRANARQATAAAPGRPAARGGPRGVNGSPCERDAGLPPGVALLYATLCASQMRECNCRGRGNGLVSRSFFAALSITRTEGL